MRPYTRFLLLLLAFQKAHVTGQILGFYNINCPKVESIITQTVTEAVKQDPTIAASLLRLHFHDCFVQGCDGSVLLDDAPGFPPAEKTAIPNQTLRGYEVIDAAKAAVERVCPGIVSFADIVALVARDAVVLSGGPTWLVPTGRRDGTISSALSATLNLPLPSFTTPLLTQIFLAHGLSQDEMITLSGAHTIGRAHCSSFSNRLYAFNITSLMDATLDPQYAAQLKQLCPPNANPNQVVPMDPSTPLLFDNNYYTNLVRNRGLLTSDQDLHTNLLSQLDSNINSQNGNFWQLKFTNAMIHMSSLNVKFGTVGEIRQNCRVRN